MTPKRSLLPRLEELARQVAKGRPEIDDRTDFAVRRFAGPAHYAGVLDGVRIAHLTDQHVGRVTAMKVQHRAVELVNEGEPDLVMLTGDFVCHSQDYLDALTEVLSGLAAPAFAVLGNHDHWSGGDEVRRALRKAGVEVLDNAHTTITVKHQRLQVVGLDDAYTGHADRERAVKGLRPDLPSLGLSHIAEEADALWARGVPLVLAGHTHAGQVTLAGLHEILIGRIAGHRYVHGLYGSRERDASRGALYVGAGVGAAVIPLRLGERSQREVAFFELGVAPGAIDEHHSEQAPLRGRAPSPVTKQRRALAVLKKREKREKKAQKRAKKLARRSSFPPPRA